MAIELTFDRKNVSIKQIFVFLMLLMIVIDAIYCANTSKESYYINKSDGISTPIPDYNSDYGLIEEFRVESVYCLKKYNCSNEDKTFPDKLCHCDKLCGLMNDCCMDYYYAPISYLNKNQIECVSLFEIVKNGDYGISMVTKCSSSWEHYQIKTMCESPANLNESIVRLPVSDKTKYQVMFKNMYCAICNYVKDFYFWKQAVKCRNETDVRTLPGMEECNLFYIRPKPYISYRTCQISKPITSSCNLHAKSTSVKEEEKKCQDGLYAVTYDKSGHMYRNKYCAICNGAGEKSTYCEYFESTTNLTQPIIIPDGRIPYSLRRILDTNTCQISENRQKENVQICSATEVLVITHDFSEECIGIVGASYDGCEVKVTPKQAEIVFHSEVVERYLTLAGLIVSIISLVLTLMVYLSFPKLLNTPGQILVSLIISLLLAQVLYIIAPEVEIVPKLCIVVGILIHYFFLVAFCWMNVIAFDLWMTFSKRILTTESENKGKMRFVIYSLYAWLSPCVIVGIAVVFDLALFDAHIDNYKPNYGNVICWISSRNALIIFFAGPFAVFKIFDIIAFIGTALVIARTKRQGAMARRGKRTCSFLINIKLSVIMGLTWIFAIIGNVTTWNSVWYMFILFNSLQGLFIAICFLCNRRIIRLIRSKFECSSSKDGAKEITEEK